MLGCYADNLSGGQAVTPSFYRSKVTSCPGAYRTTAPAAGLNVDFTIAEQAREFGFIPAADRFFGPRPLLIAFNGTGETGPAFADRAKLGEFAAAGFHVLAPSSNGNGSIWPVWDAQRTADMEADPNPDLEYFDALLDCFAAHYDVDAQRIFVTGHSAGGIMANHVLRNRSEILAGGIVASGVLALTGNNDAAPLDDMFVLLTWGGEQDQFSGSVGGVTVPGINFIAEAASQSSYYEAQPNVGQMNCRIKDGSAASGHIWLPFNSAMIQLLIDHPKSLNSISAEDAAAFSAGEIECTTTVFEFATDEVMCGSSTTTGCQEACQLIGDCGAENGLVAGVIAPQLQSLGFNGTACGGCITNCEMNANATDDSDVLPCFTAAQSAAVCGQGLEGAQPLIDAINTCCDGKSTSGWCGFACGVINENSLAGTVFPTCGQF